MPPHVELGVLEEGILDRARDAGLAAAPAHAKLALRLEEVWASCAFSGAALTLSQTRALLQRGVVAGDRSLRDYLMVWGYGSASSWAQGQGPRRIGRPMIAMGEVRELHARATAAVALVESKTNPGAWRTVNAPPFRDGVVPAPPSLIVSEMANLIDRFGHGPPASGSLFLWLATFHERLERIRPFSSASGRVTRLCVNLLLTRLGLPFFTVFPRYARAYREAIAHADRDDLFPLATFIGRSLERNLGRFTMPPDLRPLSVLAGAISLSALRKAALRGRLRHVYVGSRLYSTAAWRDEYLERRSM
jgi:Fic family protein